MSHYYLSQDDYVLINGDAGGVSTTNLRRMYTRRNTRTATHARGYHEYSEAEKAKMQTFESLDFATVDNQIMREYSRKVTKVKHMFKTFGKWCMCFMIGAITGIIAYGIKFIVDNIVEKKLEITFSYMEEKKYAVPGLIYMGINVALVMGSIFVIYFVGPLASGSGIPEVKAYLNGVRIPSSLNAVTLFGKIISLLMSYSSGLFLGPEGPMVHIGGMVGAAVGTMKSKTLGCYPRMFWQYHNHKDRRDFISSGAAAGIAAAFGAPIGGVLFSIEEASSFWSRQLTWRTFFCCLIATFTVNLFFQGLGMQVHDYGLLTFGFSRNYLYRYTELIPFAGLGAIGGLLGAAFVALTIRLVKWRDEWLGNKRSFRLVDALAVIVLTSCITFALSAAVPCRSLEHVTPPADDGVCDKVGANDTFIQMYCPDNYYSDIGSLLLAPLDSSLNLLFSRSRGIFSIWSLIIYSFLTFFLAITTTGLWVPSGLFVPTMIVGGAVGRVMGEVMSIFFDSPTSPVDPSIYAMIGSAALMAGSTRMTISLVVIVMELTEGTQYLLPVILSVMMAKWVGDLFNESVYEHLMEHKCLPFLTAQPLRSKAMMSVSDIMRSDVVTLRSTEKVSHIINVLQSNNHNGFPIVDPLPSKDGGSLVLQGLILRSQLIVLLEQKIFYERVLGSSGGNNHNSDPDYRNDNHNNNNGNNNSQNINYAMSNVIGEEEHPASIGMATRGDRSNSLYMQNVSMSLLGKKLTYEEFTQSLAKKLPLAGAIPLTSHEREMYIDLRPYMNLNPSIVKDTASYSEAFHLFRTMGLRHLVVVNGVEVVGIFTRKDLL